MIDCPALTTRHIDKGYPFGDRVPKTIRMTKSARSDFPFGKPLVAVCGAVYPAWTNSYGAVSAKVTQDDLLGVKPDEFEVVEWHDHNK